jgi:lipopolysaccharide/colanic/teichoic acid biosynthesis glycosyltransferase
MSVSGIYIAPRSLITFSSELLWLAISAVLLMIVNSRGVPEPLSFALLAYQSSIIVGIYISIFYMMDLYDLDLVTPRRALLINLTQSMGLLCMIVGGLEAGTRILRIDPRLAAVHLLLTAFFVISTRAVIDHTGILGQPRDIFGILADHRLQQHLDRENEERGDLHLRFRWVANSLEQAQDLLDGTRERKTPIQRLVIDSELLETPRAVSLVRVCRERGLDLEDVRRFAERTFGKVILGPEIVRDLAVSPAASRSRLSRTVWRALHIVIASFALLVTLPVTILITLAVKLDSPGPAFFKQTRVGENGRPFTMFKFRSMCHPANSDDPWAWQTREADPRVTRLGSVMRLFHLDELPQLLNVIKGEMSLVGPRPFHPEQVAELESKLPYFGLRHLRLPGITGWAQIRCDYDASTESSEEVLSRDLFYIKHASLLFDVLIMLDTVRVCIWRRGAR